ncbi:MAG: alpha/beta hydrolase [Actinomycetes bacterium]
MRGRGRAGSYRSLLTSDGVVLHAHHAPARSLRAVAAPRDLAIVVAHGFTGSLSKPDVRRIADVLTGVAGVITFDFRGHGRSGGASTLGDREVRDVEAAVAWARSLGYQRIATLGFSMGGAVVLRHAAEEAARPTAGDEAGASTGRVGVAAVATVSSPARWWFRGTPAMRRVHLAIEVPAARRFTALALRTRIATDGWDPPPSAPREAAAALRVPLLVVHHRGDHYFPVEHAEQLYAAACEPKELWVEPSAGHAESAATPELVERIGQWLERHSWDRPAEEAS